MDFNTPAVNALLPEPEHIVTKQDIHDILPDSCAIRTKSGATVVARTRHLGEGDDVEEGLPVIVLIHGYPQSINMFRYMVPLLPRKLPLFVPDIPGYGESTKSTPPSDTEAYSKRAIGSDILEALLKLLSTTKLAKRRVILIGHDRGARICHRLAVDAGMGLFPDDLLLLGVVMLDIVPTVVQFESFADPAVAAATFHWPFLAAPYPLPENMISALGGDIFVDTMILKWTGRSATSQAQVSFGIEVYKNYFKKASVIAASCADYRAGALVDAPLQVKDQEEGRKIRHPTLVIYSEAYLGARYDVLAVWNDWVEGSKEEKGVGLRAMAVGNGVGHFLCEEAPEEVTKGVVEWVRDVLGVGC